MKIFSHRQFNLRADSKPQNHFSNIKLWTINRASGHGVPRKLIYAAVIDARNVLCYRKDEDRPLGFALQDVIPNHP
jgi:hypothetical protein